MSGTQMRVLVVTNMYPSQARPELGVFVRDQVDALCRRDDLEVELFAFPPGKTSYPRAVFALRRLLKKRSFDVVHAHYGLTGWVAHLAGCKPLVVTYHGTDLRHPRVGPWSRRLANRIAMPAVVSSDLSRSLRLARLSAQPAVLPCGIDTDLFQPMPRSEARKQLGLKPDARYVLFPADPARPEKRHDRVKVMLQEFPNVVELTLGGVPPERVPLYVNAADLVLVPSDYEGFGRAVLEALACDVPVIATPTGIATEVLPQIAGCQCVEFTLGSWREQLTTTLADPDPRVEGRRVALAYSTDRCAEKVAEVYHQLVDATQAKEADE
ncbi:MAG: glycosyltransferase [Thermoleophilaceae bacterium]|nr:glycosyltransferase [Thermoleophilaceae bacterium]